MFKTSSNHDERFRNQINKSHFHKIHIIGILSTEDTDKLTTNTQNNLTHTENSRDRFGKDIRSIQHGV